MREVGEDQDLRFRHLLAQGAGEVDARSFALEPYVGQHDVRAKVNGEVQSLLEVVRLSDDPAIGGLIQVRDHPDSNHRMVVHHQDGLLRLPPLRCRRLRRVRF